MLKTADPPTPPPLNRDGTFVKLGKRLTAKMCTGNTSLNFWSLSALCHLIVVAMDGRANSATNAGFFLDASTELASAPGSAIVRGTGEACCAIKVWLHFYLFFVISSRFNTRG